MRFVVRLGQLGLDPNDIARARSVRGEGRLRRRVSRRPRAEFGHNSFERLQALAGASTPDHASTMGGMRLPCTVIAATALFNSANSPEVKEMFAAPAFCSICGIWVVPGIGTTKGPCASSHASAI